MSVVRIYHVVVLVFIGFPSIQRGMLHFHYPPLYYSCADSDGLCEHRRDAPWKNKLNMSASAAASEFENSSD